MRWAERICLMRFAYQAYKTICSGIRHQTMPDALRLSGLQKRSAPPSGIKQRLMRCAYQAYKGDLPRRSDKGFTPHPTPPYDAAINNSRS